MKTGYISPQKSILGLAVGIFICWTVAGNSSEPWDAKASARVNLRRDPSTDGVILSIVPKGHKVRMLEKKGLWCKVDVEGDIHGKGWVYAEYLEEILPKGPATESASQTVRVEIASGEPKQGLHPAEPPPKARTEGEAVKPLKASSPGKTPTAGVMEPSSARNEQQETKIDTGLQSKVEFFEPGESANIAAIQALPKAQTKVEETKPLNNSLFGNVTKTGAQQQLSARNELRDAKNESIALSQVDPPIAREPAHISPAEPAYADLKQDAVGISEKSTSGTIKQGNASFHQKSLYDGEERQDRTVPEIPPPVREKAVTDARAMAASKERPAVSHETKGLINRRESMGPVEIILKLSAIALSGLVILFLHRANKIATNHYDALIQFQHSLDSRQLR